MADRCFDIELSCGCMVSLDGGGGLMSCYSEYDPTGKSECRYFEEFLCSPHWVDWEIETFERNTYERDYTNKELTDMRKELQKEYDKRIKKAYADGTLDVLEGIVEWM